MVRWLRNGPLREWACTTDSSQVLDVLLLTPALVALSGPVFGDRFIWGPPSAVVVSSVLGALIRARSPAAYRQLDLRGRRRVRRTQFCGIPSGDEFIDWVALERQRRFSAADSPAVLALNVVILLGLVAVPIVAVTVRGASLWWLTAEVAALGAAVIMLLRFWFPSPRARLEILQAGLAEVSPTRS